MTIILGREGLWFNPMVATNSETGKGVVLKRIVFYDDSNPEIFVINGGWFTYPSNNYIEESMELNGSFRRKVKNWKENYVCGDTLYIYNSDIEVGELKLYRETLTYKQYTRKAKFTICGRKIETEMSPHISEDKPEKERYKRIQKRIHDEIYVDVFVDKIKNLYLLLKSEFEKEN